MDSQSRATTDRPLSLDESSGTVSIIHYLTNESGMSEGGGRQTHGSNTDFYIGLFLAISSSLFIGSSFILKKKALLKLAAKDVNRRASAGGYGYLKEWMWWAGVLTMGVGEACNFAAYAFAPATLVTPLGALSVLVTTILSSKVLKEKLNLLGKIGCAVCVLGSCVIVIHSPKEENVNTMKELGFKMQDPAFVLYVAFVIAASLILIFYVAPRYGQSNILVYLSICSVIGSLSVLGCKGFGLAIKETFSGKNQFTHGLTYFWLLSVVVCVTIQLNYLNKSLDIFNTAMVTPIYYVFFTSFVIMASGILFNEWVRLGALDIFGNVCGFLITIIGMVQMQLFKDVNVTLSQLQHLLWKRPDSRGGDTSSYRFEILPDQTTPEEGQAINGGIHNGIPRTNWPTEYTDDPVDRPEISTDYGLEHVHSPNRTPYS